ncbi:holo-acyl carrier protein synthase [Malacoplasma penetrans HF-2]|uniref:Holo-acyl carrier protein synthase n=2 Tax=Malacoplasma penetrans TaxID=28227 RepID=Q8EX15_MALP2|nr:holo-acyl carrier protein synthase [Malacoplasma penetrans HF-2]
MNYKMEKTINKPNFNIGIDVTKIDYFVNKSDKFIKRLLTDNEYNQYLKIDNNLKPRFLASRWALKEATFKAINEFHKIFFINIEFIKNDNNSYTCTTFKNVKVSISYDGNQVFATAIYLN